MAAPRPRCLAPMEYRSSVGDPDPRCHRPAGHEAGGTRASRRHLSRAAYENEKRRSRRNRRRWPRYGQAA